MMTLEALIFDVDGTMADTEEAHRVAFNLAFAHFGLGWQWQPEAYRRLLDITGGKERIAHHIDSLDLAAAERTRLIALIPQIHAEKTRVYTSAVADGVVPLRAGVARLMQEAEDAGCKLAIASTTSAANVDALLSAAFGPRALDRFDVIACGDQVRAKKPAPDIYRLALHTLGTPLERAVAIEDSHNGWLSAQGAGLLTVVTTNYWTRDHVFPQEAWVLPGLGDPDRPLPGEPGGLLSQHAWLTFDELDRHATLAGSRDGRTAVSVRP